MIKCNTFEKKKSIFTLFLSLCSYHKKKMFPNTYVKTIIKWKLSKNNSNCMYLSIKDST